jgi:hypothetical protein
VLFVTRIALQVMLAFSLLSVLVAAGSPSSDATTKAMLAVVAVAVVWVVARVREI